MEKLETDGFCGCREADADPVGQKNAGAFPVAGFAVVLDLEFEHEPENDRRNQPGKCGCEPDAVHAHLGESKVSFEKHDVQCGVRGNRDSITDEVPDGEPVGRDEGGQDGLQGAECKSERDDAEELLCVNGGSFGQSHPAGNVTRKRIDDKGERHSEEDAPEQDHRLRAVGVAILLCADVLRNDARAGLRKGVEGGKKRPENREHGTDACGCCFGSARQEPAVHHGLDHAHGEREN